MPVGFARHSDCELTCPFCDKGKIRAQHKESHVQTKFSRISGKTGSTKYVVPESYVIYDDCPVCGKKKKEIENYFNGKKEMTEEDRKKRVEQLKKQGIPTSIESKPQEKEDLWDDED